MLKRGLGLAVILIIAIAAVSFLIVGIIGFSLISSGDSGENVQVDSENSVVTEICGDLIDNDGNGFVDDGCNTGESSQNQDNSQTGNTQTGGTSSGGSTGVSSGNNQNNNLQQSYEFDVDILNPVDGESYGNDSLIDLEFDVDDSEDSLDSCWFVLNEQQFNFSECFSDMIYENLSFVLGDNSLSVYAKNSSGFVVSESIDFEVVVNEFLCGNGILEQGEQCDDGNSDNGDGCSSICEIEEIQNSNWIEICTKEDLDLIRNNLGGDFIQVCDIDLSGQEFVPIGHEQPNSVSVFYGSFDGNGYEIRNLNIDAIDLSGNAAWWIGFFASINHAYLKDIRIVDSSVSGQNSVGILAGSAEKSLIENSEVEGYVQGNSQVGGLVGKQVKGTIRGSSSNITVENEVAGSSFGGLAGYSSGRIESSISYGQIRLDSNPSTAGGFVGMFMVEGSALYDPSECKIFDSVSYVDIVPKSGKTIGASSKYGGFIGSVQSQDTLGYRCEISRNIAYGDVLPGDLSTDAGGFVGFSLDSDFIGNAAFGDVNGDSGVGGFAGNLWSKDYLVDNYAYGNVHARRTDAGGFVGRSTGSQIKEGYSLGDVFAGGNVNKESYVGGFAGIVSGIQNENNFVRDSFSQGDVTGNKSYIGGFIGRVSAANTIDLENSYSTGFVTVLDSNPILSTIGGFVGNVFSNGLTVTSSYWDVQTSGMNSSAAGIGKTTTQMKTQNTFINWNFNSIWEIFGDNYPSFRFLIDNDADGFADYLDNCPLIGNSDQLDSDFDFIGDVCDGDFNYVEDFELRESGTDDLAGHKTSNDLSWRNEVGNSVVMDSQFDGKFMSVENSSNGKNLIVTNEEFNEFNLTYDANKYPGKDSGVVLFYQDSENYYLLVHTGNGSGLIDCGANCAENTLYKVENGDVNVVGTGGDFNISGQNVFYRFKIDVFVKNGELHFKAMSRILGSGNITSSYEFVDDNPLNGGAIGFYSEGQDFGGLYIYDLRLIDSEDSGLSPVEEEFSFWEWLKRIFWLR